MNTYQKTLRLLKGYYLNRQGVLSSPQVSKLKGIQETSSIFFTWTDNEWGVPPLRFKILCRNPFMRGHHPHQVSVYVKVRNQFRPLWNNIDPAYMIDLLVSLTSRSAPTAEKLLSFYKK